MNGTMMLYIDQWGQHIFARTRAHLKQQAGPGKIFKMGIAGSLPICLTREERHDFLAGTDPSRDHDRG
jgi:hypothetical protein